MRVHTYLVVGAFILFDIVTGIIKAVYNEGLNSTHLRRGLFHKLSEILAIIGSDLLEYSAKYIHINTDLPILEAVTAYICIMELISILENLCAVHPGLRKLLKPYLEKMKEDKKNGKRH